LTKLDCQYGLNGLAFWPMFVTEIVAQAGVEVETETEAGVLAFAHSNASKCQFYQIICT